MQLEKENTIFIGCKSIWFNVVFLFTIYLQNYFPMLVKSYNDLPSTIVIGGLYGNMQSLKEIKKYEKNNQLIFNGDFHWLNKKEEFVAVQDFINNHIALKGNIEESLSNSKNFDNCNCDYPDYFPPEETIYSNEIFSQLKTYLSCEDYKNDFDQLVLNLYTN